MATGFRKRTKILGVAFVAAGLFLFVIGYKDYRRLEKERAELGESYEMLVSSDLYTPRPSRVFGPTFLLLGGLGLAAIGSATIDRRDLRRKNDRAKTSLLAQEVPKPNDVDV